MASSTSAPVSLPRVAITFCTQCRWMLRAAYFAQELLSTFSTQIGEVALIPSTGGLFLVELTYASPEPLNDGQEPRIQKVLLWDRKAEGGFPETKVLKQLVRDRIDPGKDLGHSDRGGKKAVKCVGEEKGAQNLPQGEEVKKSQSEAAEVKRNPDGTICEDCR